MNGGLAGSCDDLAGLDALGTDENILFNAVDQYFTPLQVGLKLAPGSGGDFYAYSA